MTDSNFGWDNKILPFTEQEEYSRPAIELKTAKQILNNHSITIQESDRIDFLRRKNDGLNTSVSCDVMGNDWIEDRTARRCWFSMAESEESELYWGRTLGEILEIGHGLIGRPVHSRYDLDLFIEKHTHPQADQTDYNINTVQIIADFFGIAFDDPKTEKLCKVRPCVSVLFLDYFLKMRTDSP
jgi:hypothetical protein